MDVRHKDVSFATDDVAVYLAAAGAGKTTAIMEELTSLLKTYRPDEIAFVTFTRKGVANGMERAMQANPHLSVDDLVYFRTLHALCFRELGLKHTAIIERADMKKFNELLGFNVYLKEAFEDQSEDDKLLARYDAIRNGRNEIFLHGNYDAMRYRLLTDCYEKFKEINHLVDFHDCLLKFRDAGKPVNVKAAFIDEAQDLTPLQWEVCRIAFSQCEKIRIAGDDYQSLFTYLGASPGILISLAQKYRTIKLETSYRLPNAVYRFAKGITHIISDKIEKDFKPAKDYEGFCQDIVDRNVLMHRIVDDMKQNGTPSNRWYFLFRNNCFIADVIPMLEQFLIPYHTQQGFCIPEKDLANIKRYYNYRLLGYGSKDAFERFCAKHDIKDINAEFTESDLVLSENRYKYLAYIEKFGVDKLLEISRKEPFLLLSTTHRVKGGEADYTAVFLECTRKVKENMIYNIDEELRVLYVACTRARLGLYLVSRFGLYGLDEVVDLVKEMSG